MIEIQWKPWTDKEIEFLKRNYLKMTTLEMAEQLGRTYNSVERFMRKHGLKRPKDVQEYLKAKGNQKQVGEGNHNWKGGISKNHYHYKKVQVERYPERVVCRNTLYRALKSGAITRPTSCSSCGKSCKPNGYHKDFSKPLNVEWLCRVCHPELHYDR